LFELNTGCNCLAAKPWLAINFVGLLIPRIAVALHKHFQRLIASLSLCSQRFSAFSSELCISGYNVT
jgi:hypothetical protein